MNELTHLNEKTVSYEDLTKQMCSDHCVHGEGEQFKDVQSVKMLGIRKDVESNG